MKKIFLGLLSSILVLSCGGNTELDAEVEQRIAAYEDSLANMIRNPLTHEHSEVLLQNYVVLLEDAVTEAPQHPMAATYMDRIHMLSSAQRDLEKSLKYGVRVIEDYPEYVNRAMVLKSVAYMYDAEKQPRDTSMVRKYYQIYLNENSGIEVDEKDMIDKRLLMLHVPFDKFLILEQSLTEK